MPAFCSWQRAACALCLLALPPAGFLKTVAADPPQRRVTAADLPRIPPTPAAKAIETFSVADGFHLQLVAAEPLVADPVDACFDEHGRMFVAEMHGYPFSEEPTRLNPAGGGKANAGIIRMLQDTDGDGAMDRSTVFADGISWPTSVCCYTGGIFVLAPEHLYYFRDTDGDGRADQKDIVLSGFGRENVQAVSNGMRWHLDNRIWFAAGRNSARLRHRGKDLFDARGYDLAFDPRTDAFARVTGGQQFGHSTDDWGVRFLCSNSNHIQQVVYPAHYLARNPGLAVTNAIRSIAEDGTAAPVFRRSPPEPWRIIRQKWRAADKGYRLEIADDGSWKFVPLDPTLPSDAIPTEYPVGYFTSATGITIYRGSAWPAACRGQAFIGDVGGNLVHRKQLDTSGVVYKAGRIDVGREIVASTDNWFRPVNFVNAPDGCLYILDMYRETIEHPFSIPDEIKQFLDLNSGDDRGRIYRLTGPDQRRLPVQDLGAMNGLQLADQLLSANAWNRETAQRLLWERQDRSIAERLREIVRSAPQPLGRLHALYTLDGLDALDQQTVLQALRDDHPRLRAHAVRLTEPWLRRSPESIHWILPLCHDSSEHVRFQTAFSLGESVHPAAVTALADMALDPGNNDEIVTAVFSSAGRSPNHLLERVLEKTVDPFGVRSSHVIRQLSLMIGSATELQHSESLLQTVARQQNTTLQLTVLAAFCEGLSRRGTNLADVVNKVSAASVRTTLQRLLEQAGRLVADTEADLRTRRLATAVLGHDRRAQAAAILADLLNGQSPPSLQLAAVESLGQHVTEHTADLLLQRWRQLTPGVRNAVLSVLTSHPTFSLRLLRAVEDGVVRHSEIPRTVKQQLINARNKEVQKRSRELFTDSVQTDRAAVVQQWQSVLELSGDVERGRVVFQKTCSACHRVGNLGHAVAPDLTSVANKSPADLLIAILDPNREAQPNFNSYTVVTTQGRTFSGLIASETATVLTLRQPEGKEVVVQRSNIEELIASGKSLMPEGLENDLTPIQIADVIAFIRSLARRPARAPGP